MMRTLSPLEPDAVIYTVSELNQEARDFFESHWDAIWVTGEISNFSCPGSGHWYFTLKDANASVRCAFFKPQARGIRFRPENGMQILLHARASLYETRGEFQLIGDFIEPAGDGLLQRAFNQLKEKLAAEGLFAAERKKPLPAYPKTIGVITSPTGAAIRDILSVFKRRYPLLHIIIYPCAVQGAAAAMEITQALEIANSRAECDLLITARGGGSLEDLWPFNEEIVARAIAKSTLPVINGVGHEIDFTIADFAADLRAPTPTAAAELATPDKTELLHQLETHEQRLLLFIRQLLRHKSRDLDSVKQRVRHPLQRLQEQSQKLDMLEENLYRAIKLVFQQKQHQLGLSARSMQSLSPLATLDRGYALLKSAETQKIISSASGITIGEKIIAQLRDGEILCEAL